MAIVIETINKAADYTEIQQGDPGTSRVKNESDKIKFISDDLESCTNVQASVCSRDTGEGP